MKQAAPERGPTLRCALYARTSSEERLDQAFNSLHAQREACEAFVQSQAGEGWVSIKTAYDDGGFSGGSLERPALARLLDDVGRGRIDVVVVYKIDRLTRSLADFAKIVEAFDAKSVSFVSVTQAFNTTTSMGRLTLNVLLSFAQFEREVTGERIRDKIAASKARGMWMGGNLPLGYDAPTDGATRALVVNEVEAEIVRQIFARYLELESVTQLRRWLSTAGVRSKICVSRRGAARGGVPFGRGALFHLLKNRVYLGEIPHRGASYPGAHPAILDGATFDAAQALLERGRRKRRQPPEKAFTAELKGLLFDCVGELMSPTIAYGQAGRKYRYYVSASVQQGRAGANTGDTLTRVPAMAIEELVRDRCARWFPPAGGRAAAGPRELIRRCEIDPTCVHFQVRASALPGGGADPRADVERLSRRLSAGERATAGEDATTLRIIVPVRLKVRGGRHWMVSPDGRPAVRRARHDRTLIGALRSAHTILDRSGVGPTVDRDTLTEGAAPADPYERNLCRLGFLAPELQLAILDGRQPVGLNLQRLVHGDIPLAWDDQRRLFGAVAERDE